MILPPPLPLGKGEFEKEGSIDAAVQNISRSGKSLVGLYSLGGNFVE